MDDIDRGCEQEQMQRDFAIRAARIATPTIKPCGHCYNCQEALQDDQHLFCDADCRDDWHKRNPRAPRSRV